MKLQYFVTENWIDLVRNNSLQSLDLGKPTYIRIENPDLARALPQQIMHFGCLRKTIGTRFYTDKVKV